MRLTNFGFFGTLLATIFMSSVVSADSCDGLLKLVKAVRVSNEMCGQLTSSDLWLKADQELPKSELSALIEQLWLNHHVAVFSSDRAKGSANAKVLCASSRKVPLISERAVLLPAVATESEAVRDLRRMREFLARGKSFAELNHYLHYLGEGDRASALDANHSVESPDSRIKFDSNLYVQATDIEAAARVLAENDDPSIIMQKIFDIYLNARTRKLSPHARWTARYSANHARKDLLDRERKERRGACERGWLTSRLSVNCAKGTWGYYATLAHELEHHFQVNVDTKLPTEQKIELLYRDELECIRAEFDFLRLIPRDRRGEMPAAGGGDARIDLWKLARAGNFTDFHKQSSYPDRQAVRDTYKL